jgi:hypothetical protein
MGTKDYQISLVGEGKWQILVNGIVKVVAVYDEAASGLVFKIQGFGPDGPPERLVLSNGRLTNYYQDGNRWIKDHDYRRENSAKK